MFCFAACYSDTRVLQFAGPSRCYVGAHTHVRYDVANRFGLIEPRMVAIHGVAQTRTLTLFVVFEGKKLLGQTISTENLRIFLS